MIMAYVILPVIIGIIDIVKIYDQNEYFSAVHYGDIGEYIEPKPILGIHNFIFLPSWAVVGIAVLVSNVVNR